jgi:uncharacterized protein YceK
MKKLISSIIVALLLSGCSTTKVSRSDERLLSGNQVGSMHYMARKGAYCVERNSNYSKTLSMGTFYIQSVSRDNIVEFKREFITSLEAKCYPLVDKSKATATVNVFIKQTSHANVGMDVHDKKLFLQSRLSTFPYSDLNSYQMIGSGSTVTTEIIIAILDIKTGKVLDLFDVTNVDHCAFVRIKPLK